MDREERSILRRSLGTWCARNAARLASMETGGWDAPAWDGLYRDLDDLGVLHVLHDPATRHELAIVAEAADRLAADSPSLALLVVQQNLAARLLGDAGADPPAGWVALPLYDSPAEWPGQVRVTDAGGAPLVDGCWGTIPALSIASRVLLPLVGSSGDPFALVQIDPANPPAGVTCGGVVPTLGLRGCPVADLTFAGARLTPRDVLAGGPAAARSVESLWSQAEALMLAIRSGILARSYAVARDYAAERWQGGTIIRDHSLVRRTLAELYGARCLAEESWRGMCEALVVDEPPSPGPLSMSRHVAALVPRMASAGIQVLGGYGYMEAFGQERRFRDAKQCELLLGHPQAKSLAIWLRDPARGSAP